MADDAGADIVLIPGFWLDATSWSEVALPLVAAGHRVHPLTLPGLEAPEVNRSGIGLREHVDAVVARIDALDPGVVLVGHSGGAAIAYAAIDARPDRVARGIYVDAGPLADGGVINDELPAEGDDVPLPSWEFFDDADLVDLHDALRSSFRARAVPEPRRVTSDRQVLSDERRLSVPATVIACEFPSASIPEWIAAGVPAASELGRIHDVEYVDLPTGHWPQFTKPAELAAAIVAAVR
jgi:pimeloyl-ACP methyl ester carboxylesterase